MPEPKRKKHGFRNLKVFFCDQFCFCDPKNFLLFGQEFNCLTPNEKFLKFQLHLSNIFYILFLESAKNSILEKYNEVY